MEKYKNINYIKIKYLRLWMALALALLFGCTERRDVVFKRYPDGSKKVVNVYEGSGEKEELINKIYFSKQGRKVFSDKGNYWSFNDKKSLYSFLSSGARSWVSEEVADIGTDRIVERVVLNFTLSPDTLLFRHIEIRNCVTDKYKRYMSIKSKWRLGSEEGQFEEEILSVDINDRNDFFRMVSTVGHRNLAIKIYSRLYLSNMNFEGVEITVLNPTVVKNKFSYSKFVVDGGGVGLNVLGYNKNKYGEEGLSNPHNWFVDRRSYKRIRCK